MSSHTFHPPIRLAERPGLGERQGRAVEAAGALVDKVRATRERARQLRADAARARSRSIQLHRSVARAGRLASRRTMVLRLVRREVNRARRLGVSLFARVRKRPEDVRGFALRPPGRRERSSVVRAHASAVHLLWRGKGARSPGRVSPGT